MNQQENNINNDLGELHKLEIQLIKRIRNDYRFGRIEVETRDGLPVYILKTVKRESLQDSIDIN